MKTIVSQSPILAIFRNLPLEITVPYTQALLAGGITGFEVALNTPYALEQIELLRTHFDGKIKVGAGTVTNLRLCHSALSAGASFFLSPGSNPQVLQFCAENKVPFMPGVMTPSDVELCVNYGFHILKLFPAGDLPPGYIKSLKGPFDGTDYVAVGGVTSENIAQFFRSGFVGVGMGGSLVPKALIDTGDWESVTKAVAKLVGKIPTIDKENLHENNSR